VATKRELLRHYEAAKAGEYPRIALRHDRQTPTWSCRWHGADGTRPRKDFSDPDAFAAFVAAFNHLAEVDRSKDAGTYTNPAEGRQPIGAYFREWVAQADIKPSTRHSYVGHWERHVGPTLDARKISTISRPDVRALVADLGAAGVGPRSIQVAHGVLRRVLAEAVRDGILTANPAVGVAVPRRSRREMHPLSASEVHRLAEAVPGRDRALVYTLAYAGLRGGEASFLRVRHVDLLHGRLHIAGSATEVAGHRIEGTTKTGAERQVALPRFLRDELARHLQVYSDPTDPDAYVFARSGGQPLRVSTWRPRTFTTAQKAAGISPLRRVHDLRHTAAALAIEAGAHPKMLQDMLGHRQITITLDVYGHLFPSMHEQLAARLDEAFMASGPGSEAVVVELGGGA
jgi:integrase